MGALPALSGIDSLLLLERHCMIVVFMELAMI
jgi:hypothetical protein